MPWNAGDLSSPSFPGIVPSDETGQTPPARRVGFPTTTSRPSSDHLGGIPPAHIAREDSSLPLLNAQAEQEKPASTWRRWAKLPSLPSLPSLSLFSQPIVAAHV